MRIAITTNSPGEVSAWVRPFVAAVTRRFPGAHITVFVVPCTFASGAELDVVKSIPGVETAVGPRWFFRYMLSHRQEREKYDIVVFLGGDLMWAVWLGQKFRCPVVAYTEGQAHFVRRFARFLVPHEKAREEVGSRGVPSEKIVIVGNLMLDAVTPRFQAKDVREAMELSPGKPVLAIFPGSRPHEVLFTLPFFLRVAELVAEKVKGLQVIMSVAPFVSVDQLREALKMAGREENKTGGILSQTRCAGARGIESLMVLTDGGLQVKGFRGCQYDVMLASDLALTIPGSNTLEMAYLGLPMLVAVPMDRPEKIPLEGLPGLIGRVPFIGSYLKRVAVERYAARVRFTALPNRLTDREVVPEMRGRLKAKDVAEKVRRLLMDEEERSRMGSELRELAQGGGAAERMVDEVVKVLGIDGKA